MILKKISKKNREISIFQFKILFFQVTILLEKIDFSIEKIKISRFFFEIFFKIIFLHDEKIFFDGIFFKPHLLIQEMNFLKNPTEKYFFIMEKNDFENFDFQKTLKISIFKKKMKISILSIEKLIFLK